MSSCIPKNEHFSLLKRQKSGAAALNPVEYLQIYILVTK